MGRVRSKAGGFTITELMIALAVISILVGIGVPNYLNWNRKARLREAVTNLSWNLNLARMNAINRNTTVIVSVCQGTPACPVFPVATANPTPAQVTVFFQDTLGANVIPFITMPAEVTLTNGVGAVGVAAPQDVAFSPLGLRTNSGSPVSSANNVCVNANGTPTGAACLATNAQALNFMVQASGDNYRISVLQTGKISWCPIPACPPI